MGGHIFFFFFFLGVAAVCWLDALGSLVPHNQPQTQDNFVYEDANDIYMADPEMAKRLLDLNPNSFRKMVAGFLEANGRGYWDTSEENIERLKTLYQEAEDKLEGVE